MDLNRTQQTEQLAGHTAASLTLALPEPSTKFKQGDEWCVVKLDGQWREIRFHDYADIYVIEGLYEKLFYDLLKCESPRVIRELLEAELAQTGDSPAGLRVLDLGAGNGIVGEELAKLGVDRVVGADILPEAAAAARRDRPEVYREYHVADMANLSTDERAALAAHRFTALTCVAALGFDDIPPTVFREAFNLVTDGGWVAFTLKDEFLTDRDPSGFSRLIKRASEEDILDVRCSERYQHRLAVDGTPLHYVALIGRKTRNIPVELLS